MSANTNRLEKLQKASILFEKLKDIEKHVLDGDLDALFPFDKGRAQIAITTARQVLEPYMTEYREAGPYVSEHDKQYLRTHGVKVPD